MFFVLIDVIRFYAAYAFAHPLRSCILIGGRKNLYLLKSGRQEIDVFVFMVAFGLSMR